MQGIPLKRSVTLARAYIANELAREPSMAVITPPALLDIREKLRGAEAAISSVLQVVEPLVPRTQELEPLPDSDAAAT
jgi:hypothetical protein